MSSGLILAIGVLQDRARVQSSVGDFTSAQVLEAAIKELTETLERILNQ